MTSTSPHKRLQSSTRMDVLTLMTDGPIKRNKRPDSAIKSKQNRDSLSPLRETFLDKPEQLKEEKEDNVKYRRVPLEPKSRLPSNSSVRERTRQFEATFQASCGTLVKPRHETNTPAPFALSTRSPRAVPPPSRQTQELVIPKTNGRSTAPRQDLEKCVGNANDYICDEKIVVEGPTPAPRLHLQLPPQPEQGQRSEEPSPIDSLDMGNKPSTTAAPQSPDDRSTHSIVRKPVSKPARFLRKSSANLIVRIDSKSPISGTLLTGKHSSSDFGDTDRGDFHIQQYNEPPHKARTPSIDVPHMSSSSEVIVTDEDDDLQPLSASTTIKESKSRGSRIDSGYTPCRSPSDEDEPTANNALRGSALSPTIPAPSPLPEDSPHKYGLLDRMDTPEAQPPPPSAIPSEDLKVNRSRRRSNAAAIFNEAKTLQSASSFLNGLSTSRRRAESTGRATSESFAHISIPSSRPGSLPTTRPPTIRKTTSTVQLLIQDFEGRRQGHPFKPNGFAFSRPLQLIQLKCYHNHSKLLVSKNKLAPVECAVCHIDDDQDHYCCSWCAIRMCRYCQKDFLDRGVAALRERIKQTEMPNEESPNNSIKSLTRGRSTFF